MKREEDAKDLDSFPAFLTPQGGLPPFSEVDWQLTPKPIRAYLLLLHAQQEALVRRVEQIEAILGRDSSNSSKPPSSDSL